MIVVVWHTVHKPSLDLVVCSVQGNQLIRVSKRNHDQTMLPSSNFEVEFKLVSNPEVSLYRTYILLLITISD